MRKLINFLKQVCFVFPLILVTSCSVFQGRKVLKMDSVQVNKSLRSKKWAVDSLSTGFHSLTLFDSTSAEYIAEIFPEGTFSFSVQNGFTGTAKNIVLKGAMKRTIKSKDSLENHLHLKSSGQINDRNEVKLSATSKTIEKSAADLSWIAIPVLLALLVMGLLKSNFC